MSRTYRNRDKYNPSGRYEKKWARKHTNRKIKLLNKSRIKKGNYDMERHPSTEGWETY